MKTQGQKLYKLEAVRGFAAIYVVFHHLFSKGLILNGHDFSFLFRFGQEAVILFFLLSGFVIQYAFQRTSDKSFKSFFLKRFFRIYIPLLLVFVLNFALNALNNIDFMQKDFWTLIGNIFMFQDISELKPNVVCDPFLGNSPLWSLSYEWWFYMIFFFVETKFKAKASTLIYLIGLFAAATYVIYPNFINREFMYLIIWWIGTDMAKLYLNEGKVQLTKLKKPMYCLIACIFILTINLLIHQRTSVGVSPFLELRHFVFAAIVLVLAFSWQKVNWLGFDILFKVFLPIAPISFVLYISHWFLIVQATYLDTFIDNYLIRKIIYFGVCIAFSYLVERVIYIKLINLFLKKNPKKSV